MPTPHLQMPTAKSGMILSEIVRVALESFRLNKVRFALTAVGMIIGTASLILVVTIGLTGKTYVLNQIQAIGTNMIIVEYEGGGTGIQSVVAQDLLTIDDMNAVVRDVPGIRTASPMVQLQERIPIGNGKERDILVLGVSEQYRPLRNLIVLAGRFFDADDQQGRAKVACVTEEFARRTYGSQDAAVGQPLKLSGLPFTIIGTFKESVETFGQSELAQDTIVIPFTTSRYFTGNDTTKQIFFATADSGDVVRATQAIHDVIQSRHRPESAYKMQNLTEVLKMAAEIADGLTVVLLLVALVTLIVSGVGIMNIMLANVNARIREIGIRKAIGATSREIRMQFMTEAVFIALVGGIIGTVIGLAVPFSARYLTSYRIPISGLSAIIAILTSTLVGVIFGTVPASRAAQADPIESLRWE